MKKTSMFLLVFVSCVITFSESFAFTFNINGKQYKPEKMVSQYSTIFDSSKKARFQNIKVANNRIHGLIIKPGDIVSFNKVVGPRTKETGFLKAPSYANGQVIESIGGGICQVASTLAAATIKLKLQVLERHIHSRPVSYISSDREATVAWQAKDFKFKNTSKSVLYVKCLVRKNVLYVEYWRCKPI